MRTAMIIFAALVLAVFAVGVTGCGGAKASVPAPRKSASNDEIRNNANKAVWELGGAVQTVEGTTNAK